MGHKPFLVLADYLTRGASRLRVDDRGMGGSTARVAVCHVERILPTTCWRAWSF